MFERKNAMMDHTTSENHSEGHPEWLGKSDPFGAKDDRSTPVTPVSLTLMLPNVFDANVLPARLKATRIEKLDGIRHTNSAQSFRLRGEAEVLFNVPLCRILF